MDISTTIEKGVAIMHIDGRLTIGSGDVTFRDAFVSVLDEGHTKILIDVKGVDYVDSAGLGELIRTRATAANRGAEVKLLHVQERVKKVLLLTRLIGVFEIFDSQDEAIASFG